MQYTVCPEFILLNARGGHERLEVNALTLFWKMRMIIWNTISFVGDFCLDFPFSIMSIRNHVVPPARRSPVAVTSTIIQAYRPHQSFPAETSFCACLRSTGIGFQVHHMRR